MDIQTLLNKLLEVNELLASILEESSYNKTADLLSVEWSEKILMIVCSIVNYFDYCNIWIMFTMLLITWESLLHMRGC